MKKLIAALIVVAMIAAILLPAAVYAKSDNSGERDGSGRNNRDRYAIVIGISDYPGEGSILEGGMDLFYADDDAVTVSETLISQGFKRGDVITLLDKKASRSAILKAIQFVERKADSNDKVVFYFAGHVFGTGDPALPPPDDTVGMAVWADRSAISAPAMIWDFELEDAFDDFETNNITFIFDACYSANFNELAGDGRVVVSATGPAGISGEIGAAYAAVYGPLLQGTMFEYLLSTNHGLFTYFLFVQGMNGYGMSMEEAFWGVAVPYLNGISDFAAQYGLDERPEWITGSD